MDVPQDAWVVVADGGKFLILKNDGDAKFPDLRVFRHVEQDNPPTHEQGTDRPGRHDDNGPGRSAVEDTDWHALAKERFAKDLAERLRMFALKKKFERLVLVAAPTTLGQLRPELHDEVKNALIGEIDKDLTNHPVHEIEKALASA